MRAIAGRNCNSHSDSDSDCDSDVPVIEHGSFGRACAGHTLGPARLLASQMTRGGGGAALKRGEGREGILHEHALPGPNGSLDVG